MIKWNSFVFDNKNYDLTHLHPFEMNCKQPASKDKAEKNYTFQVCFSLHCFTYKNINQQASNLLVEKAAYFVLNVTNDQNDYLIL